MIQLAKAELAIVQEVLAIYPYRFYIFGSRVKNTARQYSDLDIVYDEDIPDHIVSEIEEKFEYSQLPMKVDLVQLWRLPQEWQESIIKERILIQAEHIQP